MPPPAVPCSAPREAQDERPGLGSSKSVYAKGKLISVSLRWGREGQLQRQASDSNAGTGGVPGGPW